MSQPHARHKIETFALVALGGNATSQVGSPQKTLWAAIKRLEGMNLTIRNVSRFYQTPCFPVGAGPDYINAAISVSTALSPTELLQVLHAVEAEFGRERLERWGTRTLDLDLLAYDQQIWPNKGVYDSWRNLPLETQKKRAPEELILPHPRLHERAFVLIPLNDIAPEWRHPVLGLNVKEMVNKLAIDDRKAVVALKSV